MASESTRLAKRAKALMPERAHLIVDIANVRDEQLREISSSAQEGVRPVFVSTQKTFNFKSSKGRLPFSKYGTVWLVLRIPHLRDDGRVHSTTYDGKKFKHKTTKSPHITYHKDSTCSISDENGRSLTKRPTHHACEIDDIVIAQLAEMTGLSVVTNDRELRESIHNGTKQTVDAAMRTLMSVSAVTRLKRKKGGWFAD